MNKTLQEIQSELKGWTEYNFGNQTPEISILGMIEELGELSHAILKEKQGIRKSDFLADKKDAIADLTIYALNYCNCKDMTVDVYYIPKDIVPLTVIDILQNISYNISNINTEEIELDKLYIERILYYLRYMCDIIDVDFNTTVNTVWEQVKLRDWKTYPKNGRTE